MAIGSDRESVLRAFEACRGCGSVGEFVCSRRHEIMGVYEQLFDDEENMRMNCEAYRKMGREEGRAEGRAEERREMAGRLISMGMSDEEVARVTGMTLEEIALLRRGRGEGTSPPLSEHHRVSARSIINTGARLFSI